jgi:regulator of protease activity HflC (stomatin/prohibitin superfamily)
MKASGLRRPPGPGGRIAERSNHVDALAGFIVALVAIAVFVMVGTMLGWVTVHDYERGLRYSDGRFRGLVPAGRHLVFRPATQIRVLDARPTFVQLEGQEVLLADGASVKVSLAARYVLADPVSAVTGDRDAWQALYVILQLRLREALIGKTIDEVLATRSEIGPAVREHAAPSVATLGLELLSVDIRDLMVGGDLRRAYASVVGARKEAEAAVERARGETAALRGLGNAARMLEDNPGLLQLRLVQQLGATTGNTVMLNVPDGARAAANGAASRAKAGVSPTPDRPPSTRRSRPTS